MTERTLCILILLVAALSALAQSDFTNYETAYVHPVRLSPDGSRLFVVNAPNATLEVYSLANPDQPLLLKQIPIGLEATSVTPRTNDEVWVVNSMSDSVSVVSVREGRVIATIRAKDEPYDVVFAGTPQRAFVSVAAADEVRVFDATTRAPITVIPIFGKDPRALVADAAGQRVFALVHRSGNRTTILPRQLAPPQPAPSNLALPAAPQTGLIVDASDPQWQGLLNISLPDNDVAEISTSTLAVTRYIPGIGTTLFDLAFDTTTGSLFVANTDARNLVRFEPNLRGHAIDSRITRVDLGTTPTVTTYDLNPGINYAVLPNTASQATALAEPTSVTVGGGLVYVAAQGSDRIGVLDPNGTILARIPLGSTNTRTMRGPRGLAYAATSNRLYVFNRLSLSVSVIDTVARVVTGETRLAFDPTPTVIKEGRKFLYDARLSGNGTMSCAACHIDGDLDGLAWDLGDPSGSLIPVPLQPAPFDITSTTSFHPMKGPLLTQTLRGLGEVPIFHWRGDRTSLADFNANFPSLMGGNLLGSADLADFVTYMQTIRLHPNDLETLGRAFPTEPAGNNAADGLDSFFFTQVPFHGGVATCVGCHGPPIGMNGAVIDESLVFETQPLRVAPARNLYRRVGMATSGPSKIGFGFSHDGSFPTIEAFLDQPEFATWPQDEKDDLATYMICFDTGTAPTVGFTVQVNSANALTQQTDIETLVLLGQGMFVYCNVILHGRIGHEVHGALYDPIADHFVFDDPSLAPMNWTALKAAASTGDAAFTLMGVTPGSGHRMALDSDRDGIPNGLDGLEPYGAPSLALTGFVTLGANREPRVGTPGFALIISNVLPFQPGFIGFSPLPANYTLAGISVFVDTTQPTYLVIQGASDASGLAAFPAPIPQVPALAGFTIFAESFFFDPTAATVFRNTNGLRLTISP